MAAKRKASAMLNKVYNIHFTSIILVAELFWIARVEVYHSFKKTHYSNYFEDKKFRKSFLMLLFTSSIMLRNTWVPVWKYVSLYSFSFPRILVERVIKEHILPNQMRI